MTQLRDDYDAFVAQGIEILAIGPDKPDKLTKFWQDNDIPFPAIADTDHKIAEAYGQEVKLLKMGRIPAQFLINQEGRIVYSHYSDSMKDIPENQEILRIGKN